MATSGSSGDLVDLVECSVCFYRFNTEDKLPKSLPCLHSFCIGCLGRYDAVRMKKTIPCPTCKQNFAVPSDGIKSLPTNFILINLLGHVPEESGMSKRIKPTFCSLHSQEKCLHYCYNCDEPLCSVCMVTVNKSEHKTHDIKMLADICTALDAKINRLETLVDELQGESVEKLDGFEKNLLGSRDSLLQQTKNKYDKVNSEATKWYSNTCTMIGKAYIELLTKVQQAKSKVDLQKFQDKLQDISTNKQQGLIKDGKRSLDALTADVEEFRKSVSWPVGQTSAKLGSLSAGFMMDLGKFTPSKFTISETERFLFDRKPVIPNVPIFESRLEPECCWSVALTSDEAVVGYKDQTTIKKLLLKDKSVITEIELPGNLKYDCRKYTFNDSYFLFRSREIGPSYIVNNNLQITRTIYENFGQIRGAHSTQWVAFLKDGTLSICNLDKNQTVQTLTQPATIKWKTYLSVCKHPDNSAPIVVDRENKILVIYDNAGNILHTCHLPFTPHTDNPAACTSQFIFVMSRTPRGIYIYSHHGDLLQIMDWEKLGLAYEYRVQNIHVDGDRLTVAIGKVHYVEYFKSYYIY